MGDVALLLAFVVFHVGEHLVDHLRLHSRILKLGAENLGSERGGQRTDLTLQIHHGLLLLGFQRAFGIRGNLRGLGLGHANGRPR